MGKGGWGDGGDGAQGEPTYRQRGAGVADWDCGLGVFFFFFGPYFALLSLAVHAFASVSASTFALEREPFERGVKVGFGMDAHLHRKILGPVDENREKECILGVGGVGARLCMI